MVLPSGAHFSAESTEAMRIKCRSLYQDTDYLALIVKCYFLRRAHSTEQTPATIKCYFLRRAHSTEQTPATMVLPSGAHLSAESTEAMRIKCRSLYQGTDYLALIVKCYFLRRAHSTEQTPATIKCYFLRRAHSTEQTPATIKCYFLRRAHSTEQTPATMVLPSGAHFSAESTEAMRIKCRSLYQDTDYLALIVKCYFLRRAHSTEQTPATIKCYFLRRAHSTEQTPATMVLPSGAHFSAESTEAMRIKCRSLYQDTDYLALIVKCYFLRRAHSTEETHATIKCYFLRRAHSTEQTPATMVFPSGAHFSAESTEAIRIKCRSLYQDTDYLALRPIPPIGVLICPIAHALLGK